jgi:6-phosphogluconate dehydrogenase
MEHTMKTQSYEIGMIGLGVMGRNPLLDLGLGQAVMARQEKLRAVVRAAAEWEHRGARADGSLGYFDACRSAWMPANLIQAQRDYFGAHTHERNDAKGIFRTQWEKA